jgi:hypothetical protein
MNTRNLGASLLLAAGALSSTPALAQTDADAGWGFLIAPYVMFPNMRGETGVGNLPDVTVDEDPGDIFSNLQFGAMLYAEAHDAKWAISSDVLYMDLEADVAPDSEVLDGRAGVVQLGWELAVMRRVSHWLELGLAATYNKIDADVDIVVSVLPNLPAISRGLDQDWIDPSIVARATAPIGEQWRFQARGNVGGFGVGSEMFYQLQLDLVYRMSDRWWLGIGYRFIDVDFEDGSGADRFVYDTSTFGPVLKVGFEF